MGIDIASMDYVKFSSQEALENGLHLLISEIGLTAALSVTKHSNAKNFTFIT